MTNPLLIKLPEQISTTRLLLRPIQDSDAEQFYQGATESFEGLNKYYGGVVAKPNLTLDAARTNIQENLSEFYKRSFIQYGAFSADSKELIGIGCFHHLDWAVPKGRIGYWVRKSQEGKGYATEIANLLTRMAFNTLGLKRLEIRASADNKGSSIVPQKLGYKFLTVFEKNKAGNNGEIWDLEIYVRFDADNLPDLNIKRSA